MYSLKNESTVTDTNTTVTAAAAPVNDERLARALVRELVLENEIEVACENTIEATRAQVPNRIADEGRRPFAVAPHNDCRDVQTCERLPSQLEGLDVRRSDRAWRNRHLHCGSVEGTLVVRRLEHVETTLRREDRIGADAAGRQQIAAV